MVVGAGHALSIVSNPPHRPVWVSGISTAAELQNLTVLVLREFLEEHGDTYRAADPDDREVVRDMQSNFDKVAASVQRAWD
jgi:hypothetical protein